MPRAPEPVPWHALPAVLALVALAYANSFAGIPQYDDWNVIVDSQAVASLAAWRESMPGIRPLLKLSYALNNSAGGLAGFHALNLLLHGLNVALVLALLGRLLPGAPAAALAGALLFGLHPVNTEAVTMLSGRSVSLMSLFFLASVLAGLRGRTPVSLLAFVAAAAALALTLFWQERRDDPLLAPGRALGRALAATRWHWLVALLALGAVLALPRYRELLAFSFGIRTPLANLLSQGGGVLYLLGQLLRPWALDADPVLPVFAAWDARWLVVALTWCLLLAAAIAGLRARRWAGFALCWLVLVLAPGHSLVPRLDLVNERQLYLAAVPLCGLAGLGWCRLRARAPRGAVLLGSVLLAALAALTWQRNTVYHSETAFWSDVVAKNARHGRAWNNLGYALEHESGGDPRAALQAYERAIALDPDDFTPQFNRRRLCAGFPATCDGEH